MVAYAFKSAKLFELPFDRAEFKRRIRGRPQHNTFRKILQDYYDETGQQMDRLARGEISSQTFIDDFKELLSFGHTEMFSLGRQRAGDFTNVQPSDMIIGRQMARAENHWLQKFKADLDSGWALDPSTGLFNRQKAMTRAGLYLRKFRGTANRAFVASSNDDDQFDWLLGKVEKHCSDCPILAARSPYRKSEVLFHPGEGRTPCLSNCYCRWKRRSDGVYGFNPVVVREGRVLAARVR